MRGDPGTERGTCARPPRRGHRARLGARLCLAPQGRRFAAPFALALVLVGSACDISAGDATRATLTYTEDARAAYGEAMAAYRAQEWEDARALFGEVRRLFAYSRYARLAELRLADVSFEQERYGEAVALYREFVTNHRTDRNVEYARYRMVRALFLDVDDSFLLPPREERDQGVIVEAHREIRSFLREVPRTRHRAEAEYMFEVISQRLVRHELYVARFYLNRDAFEATVARVDHALKRYPGTALDSEALVLKGEALLKLHRFDDARQVFLTVTRDVGGPFVAIAQRFLEEIDAQVAEGRQRPAAPTP